MADAQRGQFVIDCKNGEAAGIIYGLVHDKTLFRPELDLANTHPKEFDNEHIFPLDMFISSDYMLKLSREEFVKEFKRLFDEDKIGYAQVVVATDIHDMHRMFSSCTLLSDISSIASWNTSNVTSMSYMFNNCTSLEDASPIKNWDISAVTSRYKMFYNCPCGDIFASAA